MLCTGQTVSSGYSPLPVQNHSPPASQHSHDFIWESVPPHTALWPRTQGSFPSSSLSKASGEPDRAKNNAISLVNDWLKDGRGISPAQWDRRSLPRSYRGKFLSSSSEGLRRAPKLLSLWSLSCLNAVPETLQPCGCHHEDKLREEGIGEKAFYNVTEQLNQPILKTGLPLVSLLCEIINFLSFQPIWARELKQ